MLPVLVQFFSPALGKQSKLWGVDENNHKDANALATSIKASLSKLQLKIENLSAYVDDNANVNYGKRHRRINSMASECFDSTYLWVTSCYLEAVR